MLTMNLHVATKRLVYEVPIKSKYTIIRGDSGTGKSTLIRLLMERNSKKEFPMPVVALPPDDTTLYLEDETRPQTLFYGDEDLEYIHTKEFQQAMAASKHCFLLVTRNKLSSLCYSCDDVLKVVTHDKFHKCVPMYEVGMGIPDMSYVRRVCTEDSRSGFMFFQSVVPETISAKGKDNVVKLFNTMNNTLFIVDGLGFGSCIAGIAEVLDNYRGNRLYIPKSFEAMVYHSKFGGQTATPAWDSPNKEDAYAELLTELFRSNGIAYSKSTGTPCLQKDCCYHGTKCAMYQRGCKPELILGTELYRALRLLGIITDTAEF